MKNKPLPTTKLCPICGSVPKLEIRDMGRPNGRGYPGCDDYTMSCPHCDLPRHVGSCTIYCSHDEAHRDTIEAWNKEVDRIQKFLDERKKKDVELQTITVEILEISTYNAGHFLAEHNGQAYAFRLVNMNEWDKLYDHLTKPLKVQVSKIGPAHYLVHKIL